MCPASSKHVCYYVSGHGLGHASRAAQVMQQLGDDLRLTIKSKAPEWFFQHELDRQYTLVPEAWDTGAHQKNNLQVDWDETFKRAGETNREALSRVEAEAKFYREEEVDLVVSDVPPAPLVAASRAGISSICITNFTWIEIFEPAAEGRAEREQLLADYREQYAHATLLLRPQFEFEMQYFPNIKNIPLIARSGKSIRQRVIDAAGIPAGNRIVLLYFGNWGEGELPFQKLADIASVTFVALNPMPGPIKHLDQEQFYFEDVAASVDAVLAKPGYGTMGECMANGTPVVYYPRREFSEYFMIREQLAKWGGAVEMPMSDFLSCNWSAALEQAFTLSPPVVECSGAAHAVSEVRSGLGL